MKRARVEEVQFGARSGSAQSQHHRIITGTHNNTGPTVQYQINPGVLKTSSSSDNSGIIQAPSIQYTTCKNISLFIMRRLIGLTLRHSLKFAIIFFFQLVININ